MRRFSAGIIFTLLFYVLIFMPKSVKAQDFTAQKAFEDYQFQQSTYLRNEEEYEDAKTFYKKNPTLQLREEARKKTLVLLKQRDQLIATHLTAIRMKLVETTGLNGDEKNTLFGKIDPEVAWYISHKDSYQDGDELNTLFTKSDEVKTRYTNTTRYIIYETLFYISLSEQIGFRNDHQVVYADLKNFINDQVAAGKLRIDPFNRWLNDTDNVLSTLSQNETQARKKIATLYSQSFALVQTYNSSVQILQTSVTPLRQLNNYLVELMISIDTHLQNGT